MRKTEYTRLIPFLMILLAFAGGSAVTGGKSRKADKTVTAADSETQRKADYIFMEAMARNARGEDDSYFELLRGAYELDSTDTSIGQSLGYYLISY